jgi:tetratricopeptide (TPR) repeat protein
MKSSKSRSSENVPSKPRLPWFLAIALLFFVILVVFRLRTRENASVLEVSTQAKSAATTDIDRGFRSTRTRSKSTPISRQPAEEVVAQKVQQFARNHEEIVAAIAKKLNVTVPLDMSRFFAAAQDGRWDDMTNIFASLQKFRQTTGWGREIETLMPAIMETYGVAEQAHNWPAQKLLDFGNAIVQALKPGMVYVGGTDAGRFIPTLLTETSEGESHIVLTQNSLADGTYLDYLRFRYGDRFNALSTEDSQNGFTTYFQDAQKRLQHDQQFPNEPKQIRPNEDIKVTDNRVQASGQVAVMMINEQLLQKLLEKNPDIPFALEESTPLKSLYSEATILGPITELRANTVNPLTAEQAAQSLGYWQSVSRALLSDPEDAASSVSRDAYARLIAGQANLFRQRDFSTQAEQAYQVATSLSPAQPDSVSAYASFLLEQKRQAEARQIVQTALNLAPENKQLRELLKTVGQ